MKFWKSIDWDEVANILLIWILVLVMELFFWAVEEGIAGVVVGFGGVLFGTALLTHRNYLNKHEPTASTLLEAVFSNLLLHCVLSVTKEQY